MYIHMCIIRYPHMSICLHICAYIFIYIYTHADPWIWRYICIIMQVYIYIYSDSHWTITVRGSLTIGYLPEGCVTN